MEIGLFSYNLYGQIGKYYNFFNIHRIFSPPIDTLRRNHCSANNKLSAILSIQYSMTQYWAEIACSCFLIQNHRFCKHINSTVSRIWIFSQALNDIF